MYEFYSLNNVLKSLSIFLVQMLKMQRTESGLHLVKLVATCFELGKTGGFD